MQRTDFHRFIVFATVYYRIILAAAYFERFRNDPRERNVDDPIDVSYSSLACPGDVLQKLLLCSLLRQQWENI